MSFQIRKKLLIVMTVAAAAASISSVARADYLCKAPPLLRDQKACELAKKDDPRALLHYVQRTKTIYDLNVNDYIAPKDVERWELASANAGKPQNVAVAQAVLPQVDGK